MWFVEVDLEGIFVEVEDILRDEVDEERADEGDGNGDGRMVGEFSHKLVHGNRKTLLRTGVIA